MSRAHLRAVRERTDHPDTGVEKRDLKHYDAMFGLDSDTPVA
jgi:hypothetical protein